MDEISYKYTVGERQFLLYRYLLENTCKGHVATRKDIFNHFSTFDIAIDRKTLYTDMEILRGTMKLEVVYDERRKGYFVNNPPFEASELRLMVDSVQASNFITQREADEITRKIRALADKHTAAALHRPAVVSNCVHSREENVVKGADKLHEAISADSKVAFQYFHYRPDRSKPKSYSKRGDKYIVSPYALYWNKGNYYLYAYDGKRFRYFRIDRMERITPLFAQKREGKDAYDAKRLTSQTAKIFDMYSGKPYTVRIRFRNELADAVIDQFGRDIMMIPADSEHFTVTVPVEISPPFFAWIATFGRRAKIIGPAEVVEEMKKFLERAADMYKDNGNT